MIARSGPQEDRTTEDTEEDKTVKRKELRAKRSCHIERFALPLLFALGSFALGSLLAVLLCVLCG